MKKKLNIKTIYTILPILGLVVLLLFSPCKVRNFIQAELGVSQTEVANKPQTTLSDANCTNITLANTAKKIENSTAKQLPAILGPRDLVFNTKNFSTNNTQLYLPRKRLASTIPLYILYQNSKEYL